jgi:aldose 1-epimerase
MEDVVLGYDQLQDYIDDTFYLGSVVGRYANRIEGGKVEINGKTYRLTVKDGGFHHHGGKQGFNKKIWEAKPFSNEQGLGVVLTYYSVDGEEGFPGNLLTTVTYTLNNQNQLTVDFYATTDSATLINLTQHAYFNLTGHKKESILDHQLMMPLNNYLPVNAMQVPTGELASVVGTPFDFKQIKKIGEHINQNHEQLILSNGYDHSWIIKKHNSSDLKLAARLLEPKSKRVLNVFTTEPSIHLYTGNYLDGATKGKSGAAYPVRSGLCLETQHYPDAPNHPHFPSTVLRPDKAYKSRTVFEFSLINKLMAQFNN